MTAFFDPRATGRSPAEEVVEGGLLHAARAYEDRKVRILGRLLGNVGYSTTGAPDVNFLMGLIERLTYRQLVTMSLIGDDDPRDELVHLGAKVQAGAARPSDAIYLELEDLGNAGMIGFEQTDGSVSRPAATLGGGGGSSDYLLQGALTGRGAVLYRLAQLDQIPAKDRAEVWGELRGRNQTN